MKLFCSACEDLFSMIRFNEEVIVNVDETSLNLKSSDLSDKRIESKSKQKSTILYNDCCEHACVIPFVSAAGKTLLIVYLLPHKNENVVREV